MDSGTVSTQQSTTWQDACWPSKSPIELIFSPNLLIWLYCLIWHTYLDLGVMSSLMRISVSSIFWDPRNSLTNKRCFRFHRTDWTFLHSLLSRPSREAASCHLLLGPSFAYCFCVIYVNIYLLLVNVIKSQHNVETTLLTTQKCWMATWLFYLKSRAL